MIDICDLLQRAYNKARETSVVGATPGSTHREQSQVWVEALATEFRAAYESDNSIRVFSKGFDKNRQDFGLNELLFDVLVCRVGSVTSSLRNITLPYIQRAIWQIESEFAHDCRAALADFNKLVIGAADNKLFICPCVNDLPSFLEVLRPAAHAAKLHAREVYLAAVPEPARWSAEADADANTIQSWRYSDNDWSAMR